MPHTNHFTPSQVRTRIRTAIRPFSSRGGISLRVLLPQLWDMQLCTADEVLSSDFMREYEANTNSAIYGVRLISQTLQEQYFRGANRLWHIAIVKGNELTASHVVTLHIGDSVQGPQAVPHFGADWLIDHTMRIRPTCLTDMALDQESALLRDSLRNARRNQSPSPAPSAGEEEEL